MHRSIRYILVNKQRISYIWCHYRVLFQVIYPHKFIKFSLKCMTWVKAFQVSIGCCWNKFWKDESGNCRYMHPVTAFWRTQSVFFNHGQLSSAMVFPYPVNSTIRSFSPVLRVILSLRLSNYFVPRRFLLVLLLQLLSLSFPLVYSSRLQNGRFFGR